MNIRTLCSTIILAICLRASAFTAANADAGKDTLLILYSLKANPYIWYVNDRAIGGDLNKAIEIASAAKPKDVIVRLEMKMIPEKRDQIFAALKKSKLNVKEFWVPVGDFDRASKTLGWVDLLNPSPKP